MEKNKEKHKLKSIHILSLFAVICAGAFILHSVLGSKDASLRKMTTLKAEGIAYQLLESRRSTVRGPASVDSGPTEPSLGMVQEGRIGTDSWGRPFQFKVFHKVPQEPKLVVWSMGPNGIVDTDEALLVSNQDKSEPNFGGDDMGIMLPIK